MDGDVFVEFPDCCKRKWGSILAVLSDVPSSKQSQYYSAGKRQVGW